MWKKLIQPGEKVPLKLTAAERKLILEDLTCLDRDYEEMVRSTPSGEPVMLTLDDLEDLGGYIAAEANHCNDPKKQKKLDAIFERMQRLLDTHTDEGEQPLTVKQARGKITKAMNDLLADHDPGVISFHLKPTKKPGETYPLKLTRQQRESIIHCTRITLKIKRRLQEVGEGTQTVGVTRKELDHLADEIGSAAVFAPGPHMKRLLSVMNKVAELFASDRIGLFGEETPKPGKTTSKKGDLIYQFKITLLGAEPPIWRRIQVQDCTLDKLHEHIQTAMGWTNSHLHQFEIDGERYGDPELLDDGFDDFECVDSTKTNLSQILPTTGKRFAFKYEYDFGDGWEHEILFEGSPPLDPKAKYPLCVEGERACPPEDCGGIWGYGDFLEAIRNPKHEEHENMLEWIGGRFDPDEFHAKKATKAMKKGLPDWRSMR